MLFILPNDNFSHYSNHHYLLLRHFFWGSDGYIETCQRRTGAYPKFFCSAGSAVFYADGTIKKTFRFAESLMNFLLRYGSVLFYPFMVDMADNIFDGLQLVRGANTDKGLIDVDILIVFKIHLINNSFRTGVKKRNFALHA